MLPTVFRGLTLRAWHAVMNVFTTRTTAEFERFATVPLPTNGPSPVRVGPSPAISNVQPLAAPAPIARPEECEKLFTGFIKDRKFDSAWELLTPDSQASWQHRDNFSREMEAREPGDGVESTVRQVRLLPVWTDEKTRKTYRQVAELVVDYHIRQHSRDFVLTRDVHLVNVSGGWKSLCYRS